MRACTLREGHSRTKGTHDAEYIWTGGSEVGNLSGSGPANRIETIEGLACAVLLGQAMAVEAMVARVVQEWGGVDVLVANEGGVGATRHLTVRSRPPLRPRAATNIADRVGAAGPCSQRADAAR